MTLPIFDLLIQKAPRTIVPRVKNLVEKVLSEDQILLSFPLDNEFLTIEAIAEFVIRYHLPAYTVSKDKDFLVFLIHGKQFEEYLSFFNENNIEYKREL